ncbi:MAG: hypothetical protein EA369_01165 [Bradymonadales bacterium]|nr:MAG: hypothetical protein EA369_01165 [Bradymonadales bacterium]
MSEAVSKNSGFKKQARTVLIQSILNLFRYARLYDLKHQIFQGAAKRVVDALGEVAAFYEDSKICELSFRGDQVFINQERIIPNNRQLRINKVFISSLKEKRLASIEMPFKTSTSSLLAFLRLLHSIDPSDESSIEAASQKVLGPEFEGFDLKSRTETEESDEQKLDDLEVIAFELFEKLRRDLQIYLENLERAKSFDVQGIEKILRQMIQIPDEELLQVLRLGEKAVDNSSVKFSSMGAEAAVITMAWGRSMGLPSGVAVEMGRVAALHPFIYRLRQEVRLEPLSEAEAGELVVLLGRIKEMEALGSAEGLALIELSYFHGLKLSYEINAVQCRAHFYSRIVRVVCLYERLLFGQKREDRLLPDEAMAKLLHEKESLDLTLLKLFINWMGIYPVGSVLELQTGEIAQVFSGGSDPLKFQRPIVSVLTDPAGQALERPFLVDLSELNQDLGVYRRSIRKSLKASELSLPEELFKLRPLGL